MTSETEDYDSLAKVFLRNGPDLLIVHIAFDEVFIHSKFTAFDDACFVAEIGTDDDGKGHVLLFSMLQNSIPINMRHQQVQKEEVGGIFVDDIDGLLPITGSTHTHTVSGEDLSHHLEKEYFILGHDDVFSLLVH